MAKTLIVVAGPTAVGKTSLAIKLANYYRTEIISADSRQFYREMNIGTAKPSPAESAAAKHHFIGSHSISENFNAGDFERSALIVISELFRKLDTLILVGGSGLFINAVTRGFDELPKSDPEIRKKLNSMFEEHGLSYLQTQLLKTDPVYYGSVDLNNPQRIIRALEVSALTGKPFSTFRTGSKRVRDFDIIQIGLNIPRDELYSKIDTRVDQMIEAGLVNEVSKLLPYRSTNALNTVGYVEIFDFLEGKSTLEEAIDKIKQNTRRFAKRQITWFRKTEDMKWFDASQVAAIISYIDSAIRPEP